MKSNLFKINFIYFVIMFLFVLIRILSGLGVFNGVDGIMGDVISSVLIQIVLMAGVSIGLYSLLKKQNVKKTFADIGFKKISSKVVFICIGIGLVAFFLNIAVSNFFNGLIEMFGYSAPISSAEAITYDTFPKFLLRVLLVAVLPAVCEEILHRGILLKSYNKEMGAKRAIIFSSILFGLMHLNITQVFYASILGVLMAVICLMANSIWPSIIVHFMNNFISVYLSYASAQGLPFGEFANYIASLTSKLGFVAGFLIISLFLLTMLLLLGYLLTLLYKEIKLKKLNKVIKNLQESITNENNGMYLSEPELSIVNEEINNAFALSEVFNGKINYKDAIAIDDAVCAKKLKLSENIFLYASLFFGVVVTIMTFIWGIL